MAVYRTRGESPLEETDRELILGLWICYLAGGRSRGPRLNGGGHMAECYW